MAFPVQPFIRHGQYLNMSKCIHTEIWPSCLEIKIHMPMVRSCHRYIKIFRVIQSIGRRARYT